MTADRTPAREGLGDERREALDDALADMLAAYLMGERSGPSITAIYDLAAKWSAQDREEAWDEGLCAGFEIGGSAARREPVPNYQNPYRAAEIGPRA